MQVINGNQFQVMRAWDENPDFWELTYSPQYYKESKLASLREVLEEAHHFADPGGFIDSTNDGDILILSDGLFKAVWKEEKDSDGFVEKDLYLKDLLSDAEHLVW